MAACDLKFYLFLRDEDEITSSGRRTDLEDSLNQWFENRGPL